jgi:hypothetical protein
LQSVSLATLALVETSEARKHLQDTDIDPELQTPNLRACDELYLFYDEFNEWSFEFKDPMVQFGTEWN